MLQEYKDVFEPLLLEECCSQIMRGMEEGEVLAPHRAVVGSSELVGDEGRPNERPLSSCQGTIPSTIPSAVSLPWAI